MTPFGLVVPVYDEAERIGEFGKELVDHIAAAPAGSELVFVDDGSTDGTPELIEELLAGASAPARLLRRPHRGKGAAVTAGLLDTHAPLAGFCDLDLSTPLEQLGRIRHAAERGPVLAVGSRDLVGSQLIRHEGSMREALGRTYNRLLQATITPGVVDTQCGAKFAATALWHRILRECREVGYAWDAEAIAIARVLEIPVREVPIEWRHDDRSKVHLFRDGAAMVAATARIWRNVERLRRAEAAVADRGVPVARSTPTPDGVFDDENAELLGAADSDHWWFRSKAAFVATALRRTRAAESTGWLLDAGAGAGGVTAQLGWNPDRLAVVEGNAALSRRASAVHGISTAQAALDRLPFADGSVEVVCLLDVIEHLRDPRPALAEAARVLAPDGFLVVNVPAHQWLWSSADEALGHHRRYSRRTLTAELVAAGYRPVFATHVFSWLVAPVWLTRRGSGPDGAELGLDRRSPLIEITAIVATRLERALVGRVSVPLGTSVLAVARRPTGG